MVELFLIEQIFYNYLPCKKSFNGCILFEKQFGSVWGLIMVRMKVMKIKFVTNLKYKIINKGLQFLTIFLSNIWYFPRKQKYPFSILNSSFSINNIWSIWFDLFIYWILRWLTGWLAVKFFYAVINQYLGQ